LLTADPAERRSGLRTSFEDLKRERAVRSMRDIFR